MQHRVGFLQQVGERLLLVAQSSSMASARMPMTKLPSLPNEFMLCSRLGPSSSVGARAVAIARAERDLARTDAGDQSGALPKRR